MAKPRCMRWFYMMECICKIIRPYLACDASGEVALHAADKHSSLAILDDLVPIQSLMTKFSHSFLILLRAETAAAFSQSAITF